MDAVQDVLSENLWVCFCHWQASICKGGLLNSQTRHWAGGCQICASTSICSMHNTHYKPYLFCALKFIKEPTYYLEESYFQSDELQCSETQFIKINIPKVLQFYSNLTAATYSSNTFPAQEHSIGVPLIKERSPQVYLLLEWHVLPVAGAPLALLEWVWSPRM